MLIRIKDIDPLLKLQYSNSQVAINCLSKKTVADATPYYPHIAEPAEYVTPISLRARGNLQSI